MRRISRGFTIIELLVVVAVIGILATITLIGFNRYQADTRDSQRSSQVTIISEALERYYEKNGEYPSCPSLTGTASDVTSTVLTGLEAKTLVSPQDPNGEDNSIKCQDLLTSDPDVFAYVGDGSTACTTGDACLSYTLKYKEESTGTIKTIASRHTTNLCTSGDITDLAASTYSFSQVNLTWTTIGGATSYNVQWHLNTNDFTTPTGSTTSTSSSKSVTGLTLGSLYYFRVQPATTSQVCNWSNVASATTYTLDTPAPTTVPDPALPASQIKTTWSSVPNATSYSVQYSTSSAVNGSGDFTTSPTTVTSASPHTITGLGAGATRYVHVKSVAAGYTSGWSAAQSATTTVPVPTGLACTTASTTSINASWNTVSVANTYKLDYDDNSDFSSLTGTYTITAPTVTQAITGLTPGKTYYCRVYALVGTVSSDASASASATTTISAPTGVSVSANDTGSVRAYSAGDWIQWNDSPASGNWYYAWGTASGSCASGTTRQFRFGANYTSPTTFLGWTGWETTTTKYRVSPSSGYGVRFHVEARCVGSNATSSTSSDSSGYVY